MNKYYSILRPVSIGTFPTKGIIDFENFEKRKFIPAIGRQAWAALWYERELTEQELFDYDLVKGEQA